MRSTPVLLTLCTVLSVGCGDTPSAAEGGTQPGTGSASAPTGGDDGGDDGLDSEGSSGGSSGGSAEGSADASGGETTPAPDDFPTDGFLGGLFPVGVFSQPTWALETWADVGCNTMISVPQGDDISQWDAEAQRLGLSVIRRPLGSPQQDEGRDDLLAWMLVDEPDVDANNAPCGGNCVELIESLSSQWRAVDPNRPILVNVAGPNVLLSSGCDYCNGPGDEPPQQGCFPDNDQCYPRIIETSDWISQDIYPTTGWLPTETLRDDITTVGAAMDRIRDWTDKPLFAIIEISDQRLGFEGTGARGPTPAEYRAQLWHAIIHGARGIFYFPQAFNPFSYANVEPEMLDALLVQHELLDTLGPLLQAEINPDAVDVQVDAPLEVTWRLTENNAWIFVLNTVDGLGNGQIEISGVGDAEVDVFDEARTVNVEGGSITDEFEPHALHIYVVPRAG